MQPKQEYSQDLAPSGNPGPPSTVVQDKLAAEAEEKLLGELDAKSEWDLSVSGDSAESDMGSTSVSPSCHNKSPTFSGGKLRGSGRALAFLEDITVYFEVFSFFSQEDESSTGLGCGALLRMTCSPEGSHSRTWFSSQFANIVTFDQFVRDCTEQFVSCAVDLVKVQSQWSAAKQRIGGLGGPVLPTPFGSRIVVRSIRKYCG